MHVSNKYLDMHPLLKSLADELGLHCLACDDNVQGDFTENGGKTSARYVVMSRNPATLEMLGILPSMQNHDE